MREGKDSNIGFQINAIELLDSCLNAPKQLLTSNTVFQFEINLEHRLNANEGVVIVICLVSIYNDTNEQLLGQLKSSCIFSVDDLSTYINPKTKALKLPKHFATILNSISISTTRGLMFSFFRGTFLHNAVLPIIDPQSISIEKKSRVDK